ncbi:PREDICTED: uncharacterized protein LOC18599924 [Theobroma cacao]|uniref:Uncharacterized protein LOC18599924 n=1 Tax=Theobroma cacao TaxID=3641 RepID=A0AB32WFF3_THECC|nr:PREDICTED: uncharacterized protein LOC18599924 [Theobroma cacao]
MKFEAMQDPRDFIAVALEFELEMQREKKREMEESLRAAQVALRKKERGLSVRRRKTQGMRAKEAAKEKLIVDFMVFVEAVENNDLETAQKFDENAMMKAIVTMMGSNGGDGGDSGGFAGGYGDGNVTEIDVNPEEKAVMDATVATVNVGNYGGHNGGFVGDYGGISNNLEKAQNIDKEAMMAAGIEERNSDASEGSDGGGYGACVSGNRRE